MAGADMSKNLGGMLSGAAEALGTMGSSYSDSLGRNIENMSRPDVDPTDVASQQQLMQWQNNMGRTDEAAVTFSNMKQLQAQDVLKAEKEKEAKKAEGQQRLAKIGQVMQQIATDPNMDEEARSQTLRHLQSAADAEAYQSGLDQEKVMGMSNKAVNAAQDQKSKAFANQVQEENQQEKVEIQNLTTALSSVDLTNPDNQKAMKSSPLATKYPKVVNDAIKLELDIAKENKANRAAIHTLREPLNMDALGSMKGAFAEGSAEYQAISKLETDIAAFNTNEDPSSSEVTTTKKAGLIKRVSDLTAAYKQPYQASVAAELQTEKNYQARWKDVGKTAITDSERKAAKARIEDTRSMMENALGRFNPITEASIDEEVMSYRRKTVNAAYGKAEDAAPYSGKVKKMGTEATGNNTPTPPPASTPQFKHGEVRQDQRTGVKRRYNAETQKWEKV